VFIPNALQPGESKFFAGPPINKLKRKRCATGPSASAIEPHDFGEIIPVPSNDYVKDRHASDRGISVSFQHITRFQIEDEVLHPNILNLPSFSE
jgi:hypothetical protein